MDMFFMIEIKRFNLFKKLDAVAIKLAFLNFFQKKDFLKSKYKI